MYIDGRMRQGDTELLEKALHRERPRYPGRKWHEEFGFITNKAVIRDICNVTFRTRSGTNLKQPVAPHSVICVKGDYADLEAFFNLGIQVRSVPPPSSSPPRHCLLAFRP